MWVFPQQIAGSGGTVNTGFISTNTSTSTTNLTNGTCSAYTVTAGPVYGSVNSFEAYCLDYCRVVVTPTLSDLNSQGNYELVYFQKPIGSVTSYTGVGPA